jgi:rubrerythrin
MAAVERKEYFEEGVEKWLRLEDDTIASCEKIIDASDNAMVKLMAGLVKTDSQKHIEILNFIKEALDGTITLTPDELGNISELLDAHIQIEKDSITLGEAEYEESRHFVVRHLLSYLIMDETKHFKIFNQLRDYKRQLYPYA